MAGSEIFNDLFSFVTGSKRQWEISLSEGFPASTYPIPFLLVKGKVTCGKGLCSMHAAYPFHGAIYLLHRVNGFMRIVHGRKDNLSCIADYSPAFAPGFVHLSTYMGWRQHKRATTFASQLMLNIILTSYNTPNYS